MKLSVLLSLLTGCAKEPTGPGVSAELRYPVLLANERKLVVEDSMEDLTTSGATGLNIIEFALLDSSGAQYTVQKVTAFGRKSVFLDLGTSRYRVFLKLKAKGKPSLEKAKSLVKEMAFSRGAVKDTKAVSRLIDSAESFPQLIEVTRKSWEWR